MAALGPPSMRFGSTAKVPVKCKLKYYRISECPPSVRERTSSRDMSIGPAMACDSLILLVLAHPYALANDCLMQACKRPGLILVPFKGFEGSA